MIVPVAWKLAGGRQPYPYAAVNWALLCGALGSILLRTSLGPFVLFAIVSGFGAAAAILWEIAEYFAFIRGGMELATAYTDTLGDEILGLSGATLAGAATAVVARRRARAPIPVR